MKELHEATVCICDNGLFSHRLAQIFSKACARTLVWSPWCEEYPTADEYFVGEGFKNVERTEDFFRIHKQIDLFVFPNRGHIGEQLVLEELGHRVWGSRAGTELEIYRTRWRKLQQKLGMDVPEYANVRGITALRKHLEGLENKWIQCNQFRGDMETWHWRSWDEDRYQLDRLAAHWGPISEMMLFMVTDHIPTLLEIGGDVISVNGKFADHAIAGCEKKDKTYCASIMPWSEMPEEIRGLFELIAPTLEADGYKNFISSEQRKTERDNFWTDFTGRLGFPSGNCQLHLIANIAEIIWHGAAGELIPIIPEAKVCIECLVDSEQSECDWRGSKIDEEVMPWFNLCNSCKVGNIIWAAPNHVKDKCVGSICGIGDSILEAAESVRRHAELLKDPLSVRLDTLPELIAEFHEAEDQGIEMTDTPLPDPAEVVDVE